MKLKLLVLSCCLLLPLFLYCQNSFSYGLHLSSEMSIIRHTDLKDTDGRTGGYNTKNWVGIGASIGGQVEYSLPGSLFLRTGFSFERSVHGNKVFSWSDVPSENRNYRNKIIFTTLGVPLDLGFRLRLNEEMNFSFGIGGIYNLKINDPKIKLIGGATQTDERLERNVKPAKFSGIIFYGVEKKIDTKRVIGLESYLKYTPNEFVLEVDYKTLIEIGFTIRMNFLGRSF